MHIIAEYQYDQAIETLNELVDVVGDDEQHPLYPALDTLGILIQNYEEQHVSLESPNNADILAFLLEEHQLEPEDLPELGNKDEISQIIKGEKSLSKQQITYLAQRFNLSPKTFS